MYGRSRTGQFDAFAAFNIAAVGESGVMALDFPSTDLLLQPGQTTIFVAGWAFDRAAASGTGVDTIHVWAFPVGPGDPLFLARMSRFVVDCRLPGASVAPNVHRHDTTIESVAHGRRLRAARLPGSRGGTVR